ncbi:TetR/AcrR family transcriptional regulator [Kroppenstedtia pulmonis]|uniref:TetR/AcrR family transcriptional regulator n=1 Tax=Kroppenstedtia pulmonis TaxID=1380685 RepID=A0A7D3XIA5_9BACL|nr:TetR/AcrR family transcriptional regulator [Kroppenstedtia pulmonis]QKG83879.1 TetR/AcrR family transcriptional regulator [Kroppenstedtia pulmonis]
MRIVKEHDLRRKEIMDTAARLFTTKGYNQTTVNDILREIGIAKGTFYHYFKSKEEVMDAVIDRIIDFDVMMAKEIVADNSISPTEKLYRILLAQKPLQGDSKDKILETLHKPSNADMHLRSMTQSIQRLSPILAEVVEQGIQTGDFQTDYPQETMDFLLISGQMLFDKALFNWEPDETLQKVKAFIHTAELLLGAPKGSFGYINEILTGGE